MFATKIEKTKADIVVMGHSEMTNRIVTRNLLTAAYYLSKCM